MRLVLVAAVLFASAFMCLMPLVPPRLDETLTEPPATTMPAQLIMAEHDCWTLHDPAHTGLPGHVVATSPRDHTRTVYGGARLVDLAFEQVAHDVPALGWGPGVDHGLVVYAFCR